MTIRTRLSLWYAAVMFVALMVMGILLYYQLVVEPRQEARRHHEPQSEEDVDPDVFEDVSGIVLWCGVPAALLALAGGWWLMRNALSPVAALTLAAERINERNLHERLPRTGNGDELDRLTEVFNTMTARLNGSFQRIREFTLHASHELKTPLTILHGEMETALAEPALASEQREQLLSQLDEVQRLARIVDGLTLLTKADAGQVRLAHEPVPLHELVREVFADAQILAQPRVVEVSLAACDDVIVSGDRHRLRQLLLNLADNAIKYNQPQGMVRMELRAVRWGEAPDPAMRDRDAHPTQKADAAKFIIANTGPGIPTEQLSRVFEPFFRGDASHHRGIDGCGLGLSIAHWIAAAHGGELQITSTSGQQTVATLTLPLTAAK